MSSAQAKEDLIGPDDGAPFPRDPLRGANPLLPPNRSLLLRHSQFVLTRFCGSRTADLWLPYLLSGSAEVVTAFLLRAANG